MTDSFAYTLHSYAQTTFTIPNNGSFESYQLYKAPRLRYVYIQHNLKVTGIHIANCSLHAVPKTIRNVPHLTSLIIQSCRIQYLDLNDMVHLSTLHTVDLSYNRIVSIVELPSATILHVHRLYLTGNRLRHLNVRVLHALTMLRCLVLDGNRIEEITPPLINPSIEEFSIRSNRLRTLNCTDWRLPELRYFFCSNNQLTSAPIEWQSMWRIDMLDLSFNRLRNFWMDDIYLTHLRALNLAANELTNVTTNQRQLRIPLERLQLGHNRLTVLDISRWDMPNLWELGVGHNQLTELGDVFLRFPNLETMLIMRYNNWSCTWLKRVHPGDIRRRNYGCLRTNQSCPVGRLMVAENVWICCW
ncbi:leucine-rich repeat-containing protein 40-like [Anopheles marshallii]|uniref:leucine-rich repeat-containing protein 40-like n=1 Tax=Anopheles marshallii TaxID=1521116 RepID=UPI00237B47FE|nr:leucine-rich repeat-containing protein 40-like [Anopheles marshallii]